MRANEDFLDLDPVFWSNVKVISQFVGYTKDKQVKVPTIAEIKAELANKGMSFSHIVNSQGHLTEMGEKLIAYFQYRADILNNVVKPLLMSVNEAAQMFIQCYKDLYENMNLNCPIPLNKQKGEKKAPAFFTAIINMIVEANIEGLECNFNPLGLTTVTQNGMPLRIFSRRVDGAFNRVINPIAIWEIKEYYYTETFGSRVADGIYETLVDGMEFEELRENTDLNIKHYLMVDGFTTWWRDGKPYLCRIIDMLHNGYIDEVLVGREVVDRLPFLVKEWVEEAKSRGEAPYQKAVSPTSVRKRKSSKPPKPTPAELARILIKEWVNKKIETLSEVETIIETVVEEAQKEEEQEEIGDDGIEIIQHPLF